MDESAILRYGRVVTKLEIILSDDIARKAAVAGLLSQDELEAMLSERLGLEPDVGEMSPETVADLIREMRAERRGAFARFKQNARKMQSVEAGEVSTPEALADDIRVWRALRRKT